MEKGDTLALTTVECEELELYMILKCAALSTLVFCGDHLSQIDLSIPNHKVAKFQ